MNIKYNCVIHKKRMYTWQVPIISSMSYMYLNLGQNMCLLQRANKNGTDQHAPLSSLISICSSVDSMICILAVSKHSRQYIALVDEQMCLKLAWLQISKIYFCTT